MSTQRQIAVGCITSASNNRGKWSGRPANANISWGRPCTFWNQKNSPKFDDRQLLNSIWDIDALQCPLMPGQQLFMEANPSSDTKDGPYCVFAGWRLAAGQERMKRPSSKMTFGGKEFDILVTHRERVRADVPFVTSIHPDRGSDAVMTPRATYYMIWASPVRGPVDRNFTRTDGSSFQIHGVMVGDSRLTQIPYKYGSGGFGQNQKHSQLPAVGQ